MEYALQKENDKKISLQPKFIEVLVYLAEQYPRIVPRQELIENVWKGNHYVGEKALTNAIWHLRKSLESSGQDPYIETIRKTGYRLLVKPEAIATEVEPLKNSFPTEHDSGLLGALLPQLKIALTGVLLLISGAVGLALSFCLSSFQRTDHRNHYH